MPEVSVKDGSLSVAEDKPKGRDERGHFLPGNPGGPGRKPLAQTITPLLVEIAQELCADGSGRTNARVLAEKIWAMAHGGDMRAIEYLGNRLDGKPRETVVTEGENREPIILLRMPSKEDAADGASGAEA